MMNSKPIVRFTSSTRGMRKWTGILLITSSIFWIVGCEKPDGKLAPVANNSGPSGTTHSQDPNSPGASSEPANPNEQLPDDPQTKGVKDFIESIKPNEEALKIDENAEPWKEAKNSTEQVAESIGAKIDEGFANLPPTFAEISLECVDRGAILKSNPKIKIQDRTHFSIEYTFPEDQGTTNSITADGTERALFESGKLKQLPPFGKSETRVKMSRAEIETFARRMPADGFRYFSYGDRPWSALVAGLQDPKNNFDIKMTEMEANPVGEKRPFYRLIAKSKKGTPLDIEFVVDSKRNVPVVFRATSKYPDGKDRRLVWSATWKFGGNFEKDEFKIPKIGR